MSHVASYSPVYTLADDSQANLVAKRKIDGPCIGESGSALVLKHFIKKLDVSFIILPAWLQIFNRPIYDISGIVPLGSLSIVTAYVFALKLAFSP